MYVRSVAGREDFHRQDPDLFLGHAELPGLDLRLPARKFGSTVFQEGEGNVDDDSDQDHYEAAGGELGYQEIYNLLEEDYLEVNENGEGLGGELKFFNTDHYDDKSLLKVQEDIKLELEERWRKKQRDLGRKDESFQGVKVVDLRTRIVQDLAEGSVMSLLTVDRKVFGRLKLEKLEMVVGQRTGEKRLMLALEVQQRIKSGFTLGDYQKEKVALLAQNVEKLMKSISEEMEVMLGSPIAWRNLEEEMRRVMVKLHGVKEGKLLSFDDKHVPHELKMDLINWMYEVEQGLLEIRRSKNQHQANLRGLSPLVAANPVMKKRAMNKWLDKRQERIWEPKTSESMREPAQQTQGREARREEEESRANREYAQQHERRKRWQEMKELEQSGALGREVKKRQEDDNFGRRQREDQEGEEQKKKLRAELNLAQEQPEPEYLRRYEGYYKDDRGDDYNREGGNNYPGAQGSSLFKGSGHHIERG